MRTIEVAEGVIVDATQFAEQLESDLAQTVRETIETHLGDQPATRWNTDPDNPPSDTDLQLAQAIADGTSESPYPVYNGPSGLPSEVDAHMASLKEGVG